MKKNNKVPKAPVEADNTTIKQSLDNLRLLTSAAMLQAAMEAVVSVPDFAFTAIEKWDGGYAGGKKPAPANSVASVREQTRIIKEAKAQFVTLAHKYHAVPQSPVS